MSGEQLIKVFFENLWFAEELGAIEQLISPMAIINSVIKKTFGKNEMINIAKSWFEAFPKRKGKIEEINQKSDIVRVKWSSTAKHEGPFCGLCPTGQYLEYQGFCYYRIRDQKVTEYYAVSDVAMKLAEHNALLTTTNEQGEQKSPTKDLHALFREMNYPLTIREIEVSSLWLSGYSIKESARILDITSRTIEEYRSRTKNKFNVKDKKGLYNLAREQGLLDVFLHFSKILKEKHLTH